MDINILATFFLLVTKNYPSTQIKLKDSKAYHYSLPQVLCF
jgi:hypothetical protein